MAESTRLKYDLMHYRETKQIPGLLILIDFEKAFDLVSWQFLYKIMAFYGFEDNWIKLFNNNVNAYVLQAVFFCQSQLQYRDNVGKVILLRHISF